MRAGTASAKAVGSRPKTIRWTQTTPRDEVVAKFKDIIGKRGRGESTELADYWKSPGVAGPGGVITDQEIQTWIDWLDLNGELTEDLTPADVYTNKYNPYANGTYPSDSGADGQALAAK